jgi:hypothetical protein
MLGSYRLNMSITLFDISVYREKLESSKMRSGHSFFAMKPSNMGQCLVYWNMVILPGIPERTPYFRAS